MKQAIYVFFMVFCILFMGCGRDNGVSGSSESGFAATTKTCEYTFQTVLIAEEDQPKLTEAIKQGNMFSRAMGVSDWTLYGYLTRFYPTHETVESSKVVGLLTEDEIAEYEGTKYIRTEADEVVITLFLSMSEQEQLDVIERSYENYQVWVESICQDASMCKRYDGFERNAEQDRTELIRIFTEKTEQLVGKKLVDVSNCKDNAYVTSMPDNDIDHKRCSTRYTLYSESSGDEVTIIDENGDKEAVNNYLNHHPSYKVTSSAEECR